jgi:hypothetical protein
MSRFSDTDGKTKLVSLDKPNFLPHPSLLIPYILGLKKINPVVCFFVVNPP